MLHVPERYLGLSDEVAPIGALIEEIRFADDSSVEGGSAANSSLKMPNSLLAGKIQGISGIM